MRARTGKELRCISCGATRYIQKHRVSTFKFCSTRCAFTYNNVSSYKPPLSDESKSKISETLKELYKDKTKHPRYVDGRQRQGDGYMQLYKPEHPSCDKRGRVLEHRYLLEKHLGRILSKDEHVHHINGDKLDNHIDNLMILSNEEHLKLHWQESEVNNFKNSKKTWFKKGENHQKTTL